jgi:hypothetical protein
VIKKLSRPFDWIILMVMVIGTCQVFTTPWEWGMWTIKLNCVILIYLKFINIHKAESCDTCRLNSLGSKSGRGIDIFVIAIMPRITLGPTPAFSSLGWGASWVRSSQIMKLTTYLNLMQLWTTYSDFPVRSLYSLLALCSGTGTVAHSSH